jgi:signal transduction histidine kinase/ActR/RegA family two-component response regulator
MAGGPAVSDAGDPRLLAVLEAVQDMASGDLERTIPLSPAHDVLDAVSYAVNVLVGELRYASAGLRRAKDQAELANQSKTVFLRSVSHELRTPLAAIAGLTEVLAQGGRSPAQRAQLLERVNANVHALMRLIDDLLDLSRVEAGQIELHTENLVTIAVVSDVVQSLTPQASAKGIQLAFVMADDAPRRVVTDARRMRQILMNLVGNAVKFTDRGRVQVRVQRAPGPAARLVLDVVDTGIGISRTSRDLLFTPFGQADAHVARRFGGTGLGLALSRRLAERLGGQLVLHESAPGRGSTFRLTLPLETREARRSPAPAPVLPAEDLVGLRVLIADDNEDLRTALGELLGMAGCLVKVAADGEEAVSAALASEFDAILMDVEMPRLDGLQATARLRARGYSGAILAITADAMPEHRAEALAAGCNEHIAKPVHFNELFARLGQCRQQRPEAALQPL